MASQSERLQQKMLNAGNLGFNKLLPANSTIAPNVAPAARSGLYPTVSVTPQNPDVTESLEKAHILSMIQRGVRITRFQG